MKEFMEQNWICLIIPMIGGGAIFFWAFMWFIGFGMLERFFARWMAFIERMEK